MTHFARLCVTALAGVLVACLLVACRAPGDRTPEQYQQDKDMLNAKLDALEDANFEGDLTLETGGSPFGVHERTSIWLGPSDSLFRVSGHVDFTKAPRARDQPAPEP